MPLPPFLVSAGRTAANTAASTITSHLLNGLFGQSRADASRDAVLNANEFLRGTIGARIATDKEYMDTIYPGTSPWERLGSNPAAPIQAQDAGTSREAALLPLLIAQANNASQQSIADTQTRAQVKIAEMNNETVLAKTALDNQTSRDNVGLQTAGGDLPRSQVQVATAQAVLTQAQTTGVRTDNVIKKYAAFLGSLSTRQVDYEFGSYTEKVGWRPLLQAMEGELADATGSVSVGGKRVSAIEEALKQIPEDEWPKIEEDIRKAATSVATAQEAAVRNWLGVSGRVIQDEAVPFLKDLWSRGSELFR